MEPALFPHQIFEMDFRQILAEAQRQEQVHPANHEELSVAQRIYNLIEEIGPLVESDQWVYEGAMRFADELAPQYFYELRLIGEQTAIYRDRLHSINHDVIQLLAELSLAGKVPKVDECDLIKASDFPRCIDSALLTERERERVNHLWEKAKQHEYLQLNLTLKALSGIYEMGFTRVMFVFRRALKVHLGKPHSSSDDQLNSPSSYLDWINSNLGASHILVSHFGAEQPRTFYRVARNVASHHRGLEFDRQRNLIRLVDNRQSLEVPLYEFQQRYRYLNYLVEYGIRGILYHFAMKERGDLALKICRDYERTFPSNGEFVSRAIQPY